MSGVAMKTGLGFFLRISALALAAVAACAWALVHYYTRTKPPMVVPIVSAPSTAETWDAGAGAVPAPEIEVESR